MPRYVQPRALEKFRLLELYLSRYLRAEAGFGASEAAFTQLIFIEGSEAAAGELRSAIERHKHLIMGTTRRDGSPRLSGTEVTIGFGELWLGMMPNGVNGRDLRRDLRFALHSAPLDVTLTDGDATLSRRLTRRWQRHSGASCLTIRRQLRHCCFGWSWWMRRWRRWTATIW